MYPIERGCDQLGPRSPVCWARRDDRGPLCTGKGNVGGIQTMEFKVRHPAHDQLVHVIPGWYTRSSPEMGYVVEQQAFGFYITNPKAPHLIRNVLMRDLRPQDVPAFLNGIRTRFGTDPVRIVIDDRQLDAQIGPLLVAAGCTRHATQVYLAHVAPLPRSSAIPDLVIESVSLTHNLLDYVITKLKGFADSEEAPHAKDVQAQVALRKAELAGEGRFLLARLNQNPVAVIAWYEGEDRLLFHLATRVPYRRRGIAKHLLCHLLADGYARGCRSIILFTDPEDTPIQFYRRLGFVDEVYWRQQYHLRAAEHGSTA